MLHLRACFGARFAPVVLAAVVLCAPLSVRAQAATADDQLYRTTIDDAVREFDASHWEEARALFKRANELSPNARTLRGMGMAAFELRMYVQAIRELDAALRETRKPLEGDMRTSVQQLKEKAREFVGRVQLVLEPPEAKVLIDGKEPQLEPDGTLLLDVGTHVISATAGGYKPSNLRLNIEGGMDEAVRVPLEPLLAMQAGVPAIDADHPPPVSSETAPSKPPPPKIEDNHFDTYGWIALAGAGAFGATSAITFFAIGGNKYDKLKKQCNTHCTDQEIDDAGVKTMDTLSTVFLVAASAAAVTSAVFFLLDNGSEVEASEHARASRPKVAFAVAPNGVALAGRF
jgi:hypothetical protein